MESDHHFSYLTTAYSDWKQFSTVTQGGFSVMYAT